MRSALLAVDGVARVQVELATGEVFVTYDERQTSVDVLVEALEAAPGPMGPNPYRAIVREPPRPAPSAP